MNAPEATPKNVLVTGGAGYVGSAAVPKLLAAGHQVRVLDLYLFGDDVFGEFAGHPSLTQIKGDIRSRDTIDDAVTGCDTVIHLACISNDPSFELDPQLGRSINYDAFFGLVDSAKAHNVDRFVYASSSSVYGIKDEENVTEDLALEPLTDYSKYKALCEEILLDAREPGFHALVLRPATVCGYARRLRLDLAVNILTNHAYHNRRITVFGGSQLRPNIHIDDMSDLYVSALEWSDDAIDGKVYNAGYENHPVSEIAEMVRRVVGDDVELVTSPTDDLRSYHISSAKIESELGFRPRRTIEDAVRDLHAAFAAGLVPDAMTDPRYSNIKTMQAAPIS
jgi:nucleoside-diphosphate-sugar epimerase